jgi:hypothetical protein
MLLRVECLYDDRIDSYHGQPDEIVAKVHQEHPWVKATALDDLVEEINRAQAFQAWLSTETDPADEKLSASPHDLAKLWGVPPKGVSGE